MRDRLLQALVCASVLWGCGNSFVRLRELAPWRDWCTTADQERDWIQRGTSRYGMDYREMCDVLEKLPLEAEVWVEHSDSIGAFPMSEYYAEMLQFYGAPRRFYAHPQKDRVKFHLVVRNSHPAELKPWP